MSPFERGNNIAISTFLLHQFLSNQQVKMKFTLALFLTIVTAASAASIDAGLVERQAKCIPKAGKSLPAY